MAGYHKKDIPRGEYGKLSKIKEEVAELEDALEQGNKIMALVELSDLLGAITGFLKQEYNGTITLHDLKVMSKATKRAFRSGRRCETKKGETTSR
jgi:NTP pyrophosphatase (non-canonical NTP hydrolase)